MTTCRRHWPGWRYALFLTSLFVTLIVAAAVGTLTLSSLVRSGSAGTADQPLIPASLGGNTSGGAPLETWEVTVTPELGLPARLCVEQLPGCLGVFELAGDAAQVE